MILARTIDGMSLRLQCAESLAPQGQAVLDTFERLYRDPGSLHPGAQIRFGWSLLRVIEDAEGLLIAEPGFERWPEEEWIPIVDITLAVATEQAGLLQRLQVSGKDAYFDQFIFAARGALEQRNIFLKRTETRLESDSGWAIGSLADPEALSEEELEPLLVAKLVGQHRHLMQALALPVGSIALFRDGTLSEIIGPAGNILS